MEVVGAIVSIVTLTKLAVDGVKLAKTLYKAPDDLVALQGQLEYFNAILSEIEKSYSYDSGLINTTLGRARLTIEQIHQLIDLKLLKTNGSTSRTRRRAWARHKSKIHTLRDALKECRENLMAALSANSSGWMFGIISKSILDGQAVPWMRRERWAKQIVEAVSHIHSKSFVVGTLGDLGAIPITIDHEDRALIWKFRNKTWSDPSLPGRLPPEYLQRVYQSPDGRIFGSRGELMDVTPRCDIFQLGMALWLIASNQLPLNGLHFVKNTSLNVSTSFCDQSNIIALPPLSDEVPQYYKDIIAACRSVDPNSRPTARKLQKMFPRISHTP
ncbi:hypothetical protein BKA65DRAFT_552634 [Rhexocercosporidium sp. MPI-PUGE-AT-0058]|nr:hypothetical protein BKA65DRAFT_552634 [Rhexocercosporidium sp. MPI-PUGE-AT-0058]